MGPSVDSRKQARWLELVRRWQRSKLSVRAFCRRRQVSENNFYAWRRVLRERGLIEQTPTAVEAPAFVQLSVAAEAASAVEIVLGQRVLRVRPGFDADMLLQLLRLLEAPAC